MELKDLIEYKKKEQYEVGELMGLDIDNYTFSKEQESRISKILDYHIETIEKFNKIGETDLVTDLENKYNILEAEIAILEQAIVEMQKQRQEILDIIDMSCNDIWYEDEDIYGGDWDYNEIVDKVKKHIKEQLNQPKTEQ